MPFGLERLNLVELFLVSLKELLIFFLIYIYWRNGSPVLRESFISVFFPITLMTGSLWDVLKCGFSLFSDTESAKISFSSLQNISQNYFVRPPLPGDLSLNMFVTESHKPRLVKSFSQSAASSSEISEILRWLRKLSISTTVFCLCFFKKRVEIALLSYHHQ